MALKRFAQDFTQVESVSDNDKLLLQDIESEGIPVRFATRAQLLASEVAAREQGDETIDSGELLAIINALK